MKAFGFLMAIEVCQLIAAGLGNFNFAQVCCYLATLLLAMLALRELNELVGELKKLRGERFAKLTAEPMVLTERTKSGVSFKHVFDGEKVVTRQECPFCGYLAKEDEWHTQDAELRGCITIKKVTAAEHNAFPKGRFA